MKCRASITDIEANKAYSRFKGFIAEWRIHKSVCVYVLVTQSCPTLCDPTDCSPPGSSVHGILQARILEWVAISFQSTILKLFKKRKERERFRLKILKCSEVEKT